MASTSTNANMIQFPRLPSVAPVWDVTGDRQSYPAHPQPPRAGRTLKQSKSTESLTQRKDRVEFLRRREWTRRVAAGNDQPVAPTVSTPSATRAFSAPARDTPYVPFIHASRPVNAMHETDAQFPPQRRARTYSWEDIIAAADAAASTFDYNSSGSAGRPDTIDEADEDEPYVIYSTSPRPPLQSAHSFPAPSPYTYTPHTPGTVIYSTSPSPSPSPSPTLSPLPSNTAVRDLPQIGLGGPYHHSRRVSWRGPHSRHSSLSSISEEDEGLARF
ncbi:hypothetical protein C8Q76DRAFT_700421 [Earliella scabrosa]|nr:hypothetical protein C8Q76DRAFT_700421 [Earliella scabrosa]